MRCAGFLSLAFCAALAAWTPSALALDSRTAITQYVRDTWIETYVSEHSHAEFTHGICPDCRARQMENLRSQAQRPPA